MNFRSTHHLCEFVFVETIELLLTTSESIFQYALYKRVEYINNSQNQTLISYSQIGEAFFLVILVLMIHSSKIFKIMTQTFYTRHLDTILWVEHLHLSQGPTIEIFCAPKQTVKSWGRMIELGIDRTTKNWKFKNSHFTVHDWTFEILNNLRQALNTIGKSYYNRRDIFTLQRIKHWQDPGSCWFVYILAWTL